MLVKIKFLGVLSTRFGTAPIVVDTGPNYESLHVKIHELTGDNGTTHYVILKKGMPLNEEAVPINDEDEFCVFLPISGG